jgi:DNA invertase Pin-like site-specific DNA recombinase
VIQVSVLTCLGHQERAELQRMLATATRRRTCPFQAVVVDDLSRLSRDRWDMGQIVFRDLAAAGVRVIDGMTGIASDAPWDRDRGTC